VVVIGYAVVALSIGEGGPQPVVVDGIEPVQELFGGVPQDGAALGAEDAETSITVFTDLNCAPCADWQANVLDPLIQRYARAGTVIFELRHYSLGPNETTLSAEAATAAREQGRQWQYADLLFRNLVNAPNNLVDQEFLNTIANAVPELQFDQWEQDLESAQVAATVQSDGETGTDLRLPADGPSVIVAGTEGQQKLTDSPSLDEIQSALAAVGGPQS
jgi:protein-disulfide isomerase